MNKKVLINTSLICCIVIVSIIISVNFWKPGKNPPKEEYGVPNVDPRTVTITVMSEKEFVVGEKNYSPDKLNEYLVEYVTRNGGDIPIVFKYHNSMLSRDFEDSVYPAVKTGLYNLFFCYKTGKEEKEELLPFCAPGFSCATNDLCIVFPGMQKSSDMKYYVLERDKSGLMSIPKEGIESLEKISGKELLEKLRKNAKAWIGLVSTDDNQISAQNLLEVLNICKQAGCQAPTKRYLNKETLHCE